MTIGPISQIELREVAALIPYVANSRTHSEDQVAQIAASIREFGWTNPLLVDGDGGLIAGHGRLLAARKLGLTSVPVIPLPHLTPAQRRALVIADNQLALNAGWNMDLLKSEIVGLGDEGFDLDLLGFDADVLADLLNIVPEGLTDPDDAPPVEDVVVSRLGDVWTLGDHTLVCGDATDPAVVAAATQGAMPALMCTDPPYGVSYDADWRNRATRSDGSAVGGRAIGKVLNDDKADWTEVWALFTGPVAYVWHGGLHTATVARSLEACKLLVRAQIIWVKGRMAISRGNYHWQHEPALYAVREGEEDGEAEAPPARTEDAFEDGHETALYAVRKGKPGRWRGGRKQTTVWNIDHVKSETGHSTQKPVECMKRPIENNTAPGDLVFEPFSGSGTTIIAGQMTGRAVAAIELNPAYVDVAIRRWQSFSGCDAVLSDGRTFSQVEADPRPQPEGDDDGHDGK